MKRWLALAGLLAAAIAFWPAQQAPAQGAGWTALFDGKSIDNFNKVGDANWRVEDGAIVSDKGNGFLVTKNEYGDFQLRVEFWAGPDANSGVFIRCSDPKKPASATGYEVNIFDKRPDPSYGTGAIVGVAKAQPVIKAGGQWNTYEITARGDQITVVLNGVRTAFARDGKHPSGYIALQHGEDSVKNTALVKFRKVEIRSLAAPGPAGKGY